MKLLIAALSIACWIQSVYADPQVGLVLVMNHGVPIEGFACNRTEQEEIQKELFESLAGEDRRYLRRSLQKDPEWGHYSCEEYCEGFPPPQCEVAYPWCTWGRRNLDEDAVTVPSNTALADRILSVGDDVSAEVKKLLEACESEKHTVITKLRQGVDDVSESCNKLLQEHIDFICFKL